MKINLKYSIDYKLNHDISKSNKLISYFTYMS